MSVRSLRGGTFSTVHTRERVRFLRPLAAAELRPGGAVLALKVGLDGRWIDNYFPAQVDGEPSATHVFVRYDADPSCRFALPLESQRLPADSDRRGVLLPTLADDTEVSWMI
jgi:hypothetical protein